MNDVSKWKYYSLSQLFTISLANGDIKASECESGNIPLVSSGATNNGVVCFTNGECKKPSKIIKGNCITIDMFGNSFYQEDDFYCVSHGRVNILHPIFNSNMFVLIFICSLLNIEKYRFSYGRALYSSDVEKIKIKLPSNIDGEPDWQFMEDYISSLSIKLPITRNTSTRHKINISSWRLFRVGDLFNIKKGKRLTSEQQIHGSTPYIGAIDSNNGVSNYIGQEPIHEGNTISLSYNGSVGEAFYQDKPFWATDDVNVLYPEFKMNKYIGMFICSLLKKEKYRFSYGRKWTLEQMNKSTIKLPATPNGKPDWQYMEDYIKSLPYGDCI